MSGVRTNRTVEILLVEDSPDDAELMSAALREGNLTVHVDLVEDGEEALSYLHHLGRYAASPRPDLILLDLHLPRKNGHEVLAEIKEDAALRRIPVVVMTSSDNERALVAAYDFHANCCVGKPADQDQFAEVVKRIERFWLTFIQKTPGLVTVGAGRLLSLLVEFSEAEIESMSFKITGGKPIEILLVEDTADEAELTMDTLRDGRVRNRIHWVEDGEEALAFLRRQGRHSAAPRPDLVLLDLKLPRMSGQEVLAEIKNNPGWKRIPVVIMTSSDDEKDIMAAYDHHANCYVTKPVDLDQFMEAVRSIEDFWLTIVALPAA